MGNQEGGGIAGKGNNNPKRLQDMNESWFMSSVGRRGGVTNGRHVLPGLLDVNNFLGAAIDGVLNFLQRRMWSVL